MNIYIYIYVYISPRDGLMTAQVSRKRAGAAAGRAHAPERRAGYPLGAPPPRTSLATTYARSPQSIQGAFRQDGTGGVSRAVALEHSAFAVRASTAGAGLLFLLRILVCMTLDSADAQTRTCKQGSKIRYMYIDAYMYIYVYLYIYI